MLLDFSKVYRPPAPSLQRRGRLTPQQALSLVHDLNFLSLGRQANDCAKKLNGNRVAYMIDCNINYSNTCVCGCRFCAFYRPPHHPESFTRLRQDAPCGSTGRNGEERPRRSPQGEDGLGSSAVSPVFKEAPCGSVGSFTLTWDEIDKKIERAIKLGVARILLQGGMDPEKKIDYFEQLFRQIKLQHKIQLHALSPPEIDFIARLSNLTTRDTLQHLIAAGLDSIPGGGAEILVDRVRQRVSPNKCDSATWINVMRAAHQLGLKTTATMMFGHVENWEDRISHLERIRQLQDETGGFLSFIPWTFQSGNSALSHEPGVHLATAYDYLKLVAVSRLFLDNIPHIQASTLTQGMPIAQLALFFGCDDIGSVMVEENVIASTQSTVNGQRLTSCSLTDNRLPFTETLRQNIEQSGHIPYERDTFYNVVGANPCIRPNE